MKLNDVRLFMEVTQQQAEEAFRRQLEESNRRIEMHMAASRICSRGSRPAEVSTQPRGQWPSAREAHAVCVGGREGSGFSE
ncbi:MAG TPA: hypothetical protein VEF05_13455 [Terriglobales bacterium]|nr:hypothetical protein [Terriglobales bacterium]